MTSAFEAPSPVERVFNRAFGVLVGLGIGLRHNYLLRVRGRTTGRTLSTPVNVLELDGRRWLVAGRGRTQWVRNAEVAGEIVLQRGRRRRRCRRRPPAASRPGRGSSAGRGLAPRTRTARRPPQSRRNLKKYVVAQGVPSGSSA